MTLNARAPHIWQLPLLTAALVSSGLVTAQIAPNALPTGAQVTAGQARINNAGANMVVQQNSDKAAINWQTFNLGKDAKLDFQQPNANSVTLNRVLGTDPSQIFGRITANGQVILTNPAGVYFGKDAKLDVGGLVATTHGISDSDFMAGKRNFERNGSTASVVNEGEIKAALGGYIALLAPEVRNQGAIIAQMGTVALASGESIDLKFDTNNRLTNIRVEPSRIKALIDNRHAVLAPGGLIILSAQSLDRLEGGVVKNSGRIEANGLQQQGGRIILSASKKIENTGSIAANGTDAAPAGKIEISAPEVVNAGTISANSHTADTSAGSVLVQATQFKQTDTGRVDVSGVQQGGQLTLQATGKVQIQGQFDASASGTNSQGGQVDVATQGDVELNNATVDVSGGRGGQISVRASAPAQPSNPQPLPDVPGQGRLAMMGNSTLSARGRSGQAGNVTLLGDHLELLDASRIQATGETGGGAVLVGGDWQGKGDLYQATSVSMGANASIDASAITQGDGGKVVLWSDAHRSNTVTEFAGTITARGGAAGGNGGQVETSGYQLKVDGGSVNAGANFGRSGLWYLDPTDSTITQAVADSYKNTLNTGTSVLNDVSGNITWNSGVSLNKTAGGDATLTLRAGSVTGSSITLNSPSITSTSGAFSLVLWTRYNTEGHSGSISVTGGTINTNGGHVWMGGGNADTTAWNGLTVGRGTTATWSPNVQGVYIGTTTINTGAGSIKLAGLSWDTGTGNGTTNFGVWVDRGSSLQTTSGSLTIDGEVKGKFANGIGTLIGNTGTAGNVSLQTGSGAISITGTGSDSAQGSAVHWRLGVLLGGTSANGDVSVKSNSGDITLNGSASFSYSNNDVSGLQLQNNNATNVIQVVSQSGAISLLGSTTNAANGQYNNAIRFTPGNLTNSIRIGYDGTNAYSGNILIQGDSFLQRYNQSGAGSLSIQSTGTLTFQSSGNTFTHLRAGDASGLAFDNDWNFGTTLSSFTFGKSTNTSDFSLTNALTVAGPISITSGNIYLGKGITSTLAGAALTLKSAGYIVTEPALTFQTNNGNLTFWSDSDGVANSNGDFIGLQSGVVLNSANGLTNQSTGGGAITLAGGTTSSGGMPTGYAFSSRSVAWGSVAPSGVQLGAWTWNANSTNYANDIKMYSGGGNVTIKGKTSNGAPGISWYGGASGTQVINAGSGTITLDGRTTNSHGIELFYYGGYTSPTLQSSSNAATAISITGVTTITSAAAGYQGTVSLISTGTGGIDINGSSTSTSYYGVTIANLKAYAASGAITITGVSGNASYGVNLSGALGNGGGITGSTSNITITGNAVNFGGNTAFSTAGAVVIQPSGNDFTALLTLQNITFSGNETGLTVGKSATGADGTNDVGTTINSGIAIAGPISIYSDDMWVNNFLKTTAANGHVLLKSSGFIWLNSLDADVTTQGGNVTLWSNTTNKTATVDNNEIGLRDGANITTNGGRIVLAGGLDTNNDGIPDGYAFRGINDGTNQMGGVSIGTGSVLGNGITLSSGGGNIIVRGRTWLAAATGQYPGIISQGKFVINSGTGTIDIVGDTNSSHGIEFGWGVSGLNYAITSASTDNTKPAINISSTTSTGGDYTGLVLGARDGSWLIQSLGATGGGVTISGSNNYGTGYGVISNATTAYVLSKAGTITLSGDGGSSAGREFISNSNTAIGSYAGTATSVNGIAVGVTSSSANVSIVSNSISFGAGSAIRTTGDVNLTSVADSFNATTSLPAISIAPNTLTLGKTTNTANLTLLGPVVTNQALTLYGGTLTIKGDITTPGDVTLYAQNGGSIYWGSNTASADLIHTGNSTVNVLMRTTAGGGIFIDGVSSTNRSDFSAGTGKLNFVFWTRYNSATGAGIGQVTLNDSTFTTNGGHVWVGGGAPASSTWNGLSVGAGTVRNTTGDAIALQVANTNITTAGGHVAMSAEAAYSHATNWTSSQLGIYMSSSGITTQSGTINLTGIVSGRQYNGGYALDLYNTQLVSTTGAITLRGDVSSTANVGYDGAQRTFATYIHNKSLVQTTTGPINIYGTSTANALYGAAIWVGTNAFDANGDGNVTTVGSVANGYSTAIVSDSGAILLDGRMTTTRTDGWSHSLVFLSRVYDRSLIQTNSGNITLKGYANTPKGDSTGAVFQMEGNSSGFSFLSNTGDIYLQAFQEARSTATYNNAIRFGPSAMSNSIRFGAATDTSTYTGRLTIEGDSILNADSGVTGSIKAYGTNAVSFSSSSASSTKDFTLGTMWDLGTEHSSISIGKLTETKNVNLEADLFAKGPITVYGGDITLRRDLTSTLAAAPIQLIAKGSIRGDTRYKTISTNAGEVTLAADSDGNGSGNIVIVSGLTIDTRRHIFSVSGYDGWNTTAAGNLKYVTSTAAIDQNWLGGSPYEAAVGVDTFTVSYTHTFTAPTTGAYTFYSNSDDGARLTLNNVASTDINNLGISGGARTANFNLVAGTSYNLRYDVSENGGYAAAKLEWASTAAGIARQVFTGFSNNTMTGGAKITLGGGNSQGTGFASGVGYTNAEGIRVDGGLTLMSGGTNITLKGRSWAGGSADGWGAWGVGSWNGPFTADAGVGKIYIEGISRDTGGSSIKQGVVTNGAVAIHSAFAGADAIVIKGSNTTTGGGWNHGIDIGGNNEGGNWYGYQKIVASGVGGGITLDGYANEWALLIRNGTDLITNGGPLNLLGATRQGGGGANLYLRNTAFQQWGSAASYTGLSADTDLTIRFDGYNFGGWTPKVATTGDVVWQSFAPTFGQDVYASWFNWNQNGKTMGSLTIGKPSNTTRAVYFNGVGEVAGAAINVAGPITAYGSLVYTSTPINVTGTGDIFFQGFTNATTSINIDSPINKTGGGDATITLKGNQRVNTNASITASGTGTGKLNMVFWSDADATLNGGVSFFVNPTMTTKGGHIWMGGNGGAAPNASTTWNGLTVGAGASVGSYTANWNGMDLQGTFNTGGGDFYAAGKTYVVSNASWDINATGNSIAVNAGAGNITFVGNRIDFGGVYTPGTKTTLSTTGVLTIKPFNDNFGYTFNLQGAMSGANWVGVSTDGVTGSRNLVIQNVANLGGLVIGKDTNASLVSVNSSLSIAGDISLYGGQIRNQNSASLTSTAGSLLLDADLDRGLNFDGAGIYWTSGLNAPSTAAGKGNVTLLARGGSKPTGTNINDGLLMYGSSAGVSAGGDVTLRGWAQTNGNLGIQMTGGNTISAGRSLSLDGRNLTTVNSGNLYGLFVGSSVQLSAAGTIDITAQAGGSSTRALLIFPGVGITTTGTAGTSGITLQALNGGTIGSNDGNTGTNVGATITAGAGSGITLRADSLDFIPTRPLTLNTSGTLTIEPSGSRFAGNFAWDGALSGNNMVGLQSMANITVNNVANLGGLTLGKAGNTSNISISTPTSVKGTIALLGHAVTINEALTAAGNATAANNRIVITATGEVTQSADGELIANGLGLLGTGRFTLTNPNNNVSVLAAGSADTRVRSLSYVDANGVTVGTVNPTGVSSSGRVLIETVSGDITVSENIDTTSVAIDAVTLNAGKGKAVAEAAAFYDGSGGNITLATGKTITAGSGGRLTLFTGTVSGSTGITTLVGSGSGRFRYASDETTANYITPLTSGLNVIYRERPTLSLKGVNESIVYGTDPLLNVTATGMQNGDTVVQSMGQLPTVTLKDTTNTTAVRNSAGFFNVLRTGSDVVGYTMSLTADAASKLGYALTYDHTGTTTVTPKALTAVINDDAKFFGLNDNVGYAGATITGFVRGETVSNIAPTFNITRTNSTVNALGSYNGVLTGTISLADGNYNLPTANVTAGNFHVVDANTLIVRVGSATAVYGNSANYDVSHVRYYNSSSNAEVSLTQGSSELNWNVGGNAGQAVNFTLNSAGVNVGSHAITGTVTTPHTLPNTTNVNTPGQLLAIGGKLTITPRPLTLNASKTFDGTDTVTGSELTLGNLYNTETLTYSGAKLSDRNVATSNKYITNLTLANGTNGGLASNYELPSLSAYNVSNNSASISARALGVSVQKVYDGLNTATAAQTTLSNLASGEALTINSVTLSNSHVATANKYVSALSLADSGPFLLSNYSLPNLTAASASNAATITAKDLLVTVSSSSGTSKTYDGNTSSSLTATLSASGFLTGESATVSFGSAAYNNKNVTEANQITLSSITLGSISGGSSSSLASDYNLDTTAAVVRGTITPRAITAAAAAAPNKVYDGTTGIDGAIVAISSSTPKIGTDDVNIVAVGGSFSSSDAGTGRTYSLADISLSGTAASNYSLSSGSISGSDGVITPRPLTLTASKVYDGTTTLGDVTLGNLVQGQYLNFSALTTNSARVAATGKFVKTITLSNVLDGTNPVYKTSNYSLPGVSTAIVSGAANTLTANANNTATITPAPLTVTLDDTLVSKVYDGLSTYSAYTPSYTVTGFVSGDTAAALTQTGRDFNASTVAAASSFTISGISISSVTGTNSSAASDYALSATSIVAAGSITPRQIAVDVNAGVRKVYDTTTSFNNLNISLGQVRDDSNNVVAGTGLITGDVVNVSATGGGFDDKNAGSNKSYTLTGLTLGGANATNYVLASGDSISGINGIIDAKTLGVTGLTVTSKAYDGSTTATYTGTAALLPAVAVGPNTANDGKPYVDDVVTLSGSISAAAFNTKDVTTANTVTFTGLSLTGGDASNYSLTATAAGSITPRTVSITPTVASKTYDKTTAVTVSGATLGNLVGTENFTTSGTGVLNSANAGSRTALLSFTYNTPVNGALAANYDLPASTTVSVNVLPKGLAVTGSSALNKTYDGTNALTAAGHGGLPSGVIAGDTVSLAGAPSYQFSDVLRNASGVVQSQAIVQGTLALAGDSASNYSLNWTNGTGTINPVALTLVTPVVSSKTYDGNTQATVAAAGTPTGYLGTQTLSITPLAQFADANAGASKAYTVSYQLADGTNGGKATNYSLADVSVGTGGSNTVAIERKVLGLTGLVVSDKVYDGLSTATIASNGVLSGMVGTQTLNLGGSATASFANKSAELNKTVTISGLSLSNGTNGGLASNYILGASGTLTTTASITPKPLTISGITVTSKVYDATTAATLNTSAMAKTGLVTVGSTVDEVIVTATGLYDTKNVGASKTVTLTETISGADASNYIITKQGTATGAITPATLTLTGSSGVTKTYDGITSMPVGTTGYGSLTGVITVNSVTDTVSITGAPVFASASVARVGNVVSGAVTTQAINQGSVALSGADAGNYNLSWTNGSGTINPATLTVRVNDDAKFVTKSDPTFTVSYSGFKNGETATTVNLLSGALSLSRNTTGPDSDPTGGNQQAGIYTGALSASASTLLANNYNITYQSGNFTVVPADQLLVRVQNAQAIYGQAPTYIVNSASYLDSGNNEVVIPNSGVSVSGSSVSVTDGVNNQASFDLSLINASSSSSGKSLVGAYQLSSSNLVKSGANFNSLTVVGSLEISPKALTLTSADVNSASKTKVYDGTVGMSGLTLTSSGVVSSSASPPVRDLVNISGSGAFADKNATATANKQYTISGIAMDGADSGNYYLSANSFNGTDGQITPRTLTVTYTGVNKTYDASTAATVTTTDDRVAGDNFTIAKTAAFANKHVANGKSISITGVSLSTGDADNYTVASSVANATSANITAAPLRVSGIVAADKVYNGTDVAILTLPTINAGMGLLSNGGTADVVTFNTSSAAFADANAGVGKTVNITATFNGADASNYSITYQPTTVATISRRPVTVSAASGVSKVYDSTTAMNQVTLGLSIDGVNNTPANEGVIADHLTSGAVSTANLSVSGVGQFDSANVGTGLGYSLRNLQLSGTQAGNYIISGGVTNITGNNGSITVAPLTITAKNQSMNFGTSLALGSSEYTVTGLKGVDAVSTVNLAVAGNTTVPSSQAPGTADIVPSLALGTGLSNYQITYNNGTLTVSRATLVVTPVDKSRVYGSANPVFSQNITGFIGNDTAASLSLQPLLGTSTATSTSDVGSYTIVGNITGYTSTVYQFVAGTGTLTVTPRYLDLTISGANKVYDGTTTAPVTVSYANPVSDNLQIAVTASLNNKNVGTGRTVTVSGVTLNGTAASNYVLNSYNTSATANVTQLASATWVGGSTGEWFNPANWASTASLSTTGTVPDLQNVAAVVLPANTTVSFNSANVSGTALADPVTVASISGSGALSVARGSLTVSGNTNLNGYQQTGGALNVGGNMVVNTRNGLSQTAGQLTVTGDVQWRADTVQNQDASLLGTNRWSGVTSFTGVNAGTWRNIAFLADGNINLGNVAATGNFSATVANNLNLSGTLNVGSLDLTATAGNITQSAGTLTVTNGPTNLTAGGDITLESAGNNFNGLVNASGVNISLADADALTLGTVTATGNLSLNNNGPLNLGTSTVGGNLSATSGGGAITQSGALIVNGNTTLNAGAGDITLTDFRNNFGGTVNAAGSNIALTDVDTLTLGTVTATGNLTLINTGALNLGTSTVGGNLSANSGGGDITQTGALTVNGSTSLNAGTGNITLDNATNNFGGAVNASGADVTLVDGTGGLTLGNITATGNLTANSTGGAITDAPGSTVTVNGSTTLSASNNGTPADITLDNATNNFAGTVNANGANVTLVDGTGGLTLGNITATGGFTANSTGGAMTDAPGSTVNVNGSTTVSATNNGAPADITLDNATNNFAGTVNASGANVTLVDGTGGLTLGNITATGGLTANSTGGAITDAAGSTVYVSGTTTVSATNNGAPADITLDNATNNFGGAVNATGGDITLVDGTGGLILGNITATGGLTANSTGGAITDAPGSTVTVNGTTTVSATNNGSPADITLDNATNNFAGTVNANGANVTLVDGTGGLTLGNITATGGLTANSTGGAITDAPGSTVNVNGTTTVSATNNGAPADITLDNATNNFAGTVNASGANVTLVDGTGGLTLGNITATGGLTANSTGGAITDAPGSTVNVNGSTTVSATNNGAPADITLDNATNNFAGTVNAIGANVTLVDGTGGLTLGNITATGGLTANSTGGAITDAPGSTVTVNGSTTLSASNNGTPADITLDNATNNFAGVVNANAANILLTDSNELTLGTVTATGNLTLNNTGALNLGTSTVGGSLSANSGGGAITQDGPLVVNQQSVFDAGSGAVRLTAVGNQLTNGVTVTAANYLIEGDAQKNAMQIAASTQSSISVPVVTNVNTTSVTASAPLLVVATVPAPAPATVPATAPAASSETTAVETSTPATPVAPVVVPVVPVAPVAPVVPVPPPPVAPAAPTAAAASSAAASSSSSSASSSEIGGGVAGSSNSAGVIVDFKGSVGTTASNIVAISVPKGTAVSGVGFSFELPESIKTAAQQATEPPKALQADGSPLPSWLKFDPQRLRFDSEAVPDSAFPMQIVMVVGQDRVIVVISERSQ